MTTIDITGITDRRFRSRVATRLEELVAGLESDPVRILVAFSDDNGPKGGVDTRCAMTLRLPYRPVLRAEDLAETERLAFDGAFAALERQVSRYRERRLDRVRRPKKYFVAKTLLTGAESKPPRPSRSRRRKEV